MSALIQTEAVSAGDEPRVRTVQDVIDRVAEQADGRDLRDVERLLVAELDGAGLKVPSRTWLDSVARDLAKGEPYVVSVEATRGPDVPPGGHEHQYYAPARLRVEPVTPSGETPADPPVPIKTPATMERRHAAWLVALATLPLLYLILRQRRRIRRAERSNQTSRREGHHDRQRALRP
jgi:hypothetical protein